jgi:hypothetical protein
VVSLFVFVPTIIATAVDALNDGSVAAIDHATGCCAVAGNTSATSAGNNNIEYNADDIISDYCSAEIDPNIVEDTGVVVLDNTNCTRGCGLFYSLELGHCVINICIEYTSTHGKTCFCYIAG